ncbi:MAG: endolytic transglycosylase MltG [Bacteroidales bacterium]|jgi:UPF0755 protein|nr:endolytic transglycosylase MltG [Bacteroidales bacterium]
MVKSKKRKGKKKANKKIMLAAFCIVLALLIGIASLITSVFTAPVMKDDYELYIAGKNFKSVTDSLEASGKVKMWQFKLLSRIFKYDNNSVKCGYYFLSSNSTGTSIVRKLRAGAQDEKKLTFNRLVSIEDAANKLSRDLEIDSIDMIKLLSDNEFLSNYSLDDGDVTTQNVLACFIPNTYNVFWDVTAEELFHRLYFEQEKFWNEERLAKAKAINMNRTEVMTLASIVELETDRNSEKKLIASVYLNRLRKGILLQADPTVKFAIGDRKIKRILYSHLKYESPYNTYINKGLPPGPICTPTLSSINAVLENYKTPYYYFCASPDFSGAHVFAKTGAEHAVNAAAYHAALDARREQREQEVTQESNQE